MAYAARFNSTKRTEDQQIVTPDAAAIEAHKNSGLTTSHPSPEIITADSVSDAPCESQGWLQRMPCFGAEC